MPVKMKVCQSHEKLYDDEQNYRNKMSFRIAVCSSDFNGACFTSNGVATRLKFCDLIFCSSCHRLFESVFKKLVNNIFGYDWGR